MQRAPSSSSSLYDQEKGSGGFKALYQKNGNVNKIIGTLSCLLPKTTRNKTINPVNHPKSFGNPLLRGIFQCNLLRFTFIDKKAFYQDRLGIMQYYYVLE